MVPSVLCAGTWTDYLETLDSHVYGPRDVLWLNMVEQEQGESFSVPPSVRCHFLPYQHLGVLLPRRRSSKPLTRGPAKPQLCTRDRNKYYLLQRLKQPLICMRLREDLMLKRGQILSRKSRRPGSSNTCSTPSS